MATILFLALRAARLSLACPYTAGYSPIMTCQRRVTHYSLQDAFRKAPIMSEEFYRMKRLPPYVIA
ncbi:MAG TPA: aminotransferase, partial [Sphingobium sp.]|nr:aminotransferase [Sphingobium sp.]